MKKFPFYQQLDQMDCGPTCLRMVAKYYGRSYNTAQLRELAEIGKDGVNLLGIAQAAERVGFKALGVKVTLNKLLEEAPLPCIVHWGQNHFVVVCSPPRPRWGSFSSFSFKRRRTVRRAGQGVEVADPAAGLLTYTLQEFESRWATTVNEDGEKVGIALLLEAPPAPGGGAIDFDENKNRKVGLRLLWGQVWRYRGLLFQVGLGLLAGSLLQLMLPFLTKSVVDVGIQTRNLQFVYLVLGAQLALMIGRMSVEFIRSWILLHISTRVNLSILSDFLAKLLRLPIAYFEAKTTGDIMQRIGDHRRIEQFLTGTSFECVVFDVQSRGVQFCAGLLQFAHFWGFYGGFGFVCRLDYAVSQTPPRPRPQAVCAGCAKSKQPHATHCLRTRTQTQ